MPHVTPSMSAARRVIATHGGAALLPLSNSESHVGGRRQQPQLRPVAHFPDFSVSPSGGGLAVKKMLRRQVEMWRFIPPSLFLAERRSKPYSYIAALEGPTATVDIVTRRHCHKIEIAGWIEHTRRNDNMSLSAKESAGLET